MGQAGGEWGLDPPLVHFSAMQSPIDWEITTTNGPAGPFHARTPEPDGGHRLWIHRLEGPALVLGSAQPDELVRRAQAEADGIEVCRRRSGGGLVFIDPRSDCWIDAIVPRSSPLWDDDVARAFHWLGELWTSVLATLTTSPGRAEPDPAPIMARSSATTELGRVWCFADLGHGEVSVAGSKVIGLSQRRTKSWARFQALLLGDWPGDRLLPYVDLEQLVARQPGRFSDPEHLRPGLVNAGFPDTMPPPAPPMVAERFIATITTTH